jgi:4-hydroxyacetophenone monooxygenase
MTTNEDTIVMTATDDELRDALVDANLPTLLVVLAHMSADPKWLADPYRPTRTLGMNDNDHGGLSADRAEEIRAAAFDVLRRWRDGNLKLPEPPSEDAMIDLLSVSLGEEVSPEYSTTMAEEAGFLPRQGSWTDGRPRRADQFHVVIIGAGASGLTTAVTLKRLGIRYTIIERNSDVGGVWLENDYPGAGVDTPSHLYAFSFAPNREWSRYYAKQPEIIAYLRRCAKDLRLRDDIRFNTEVLATRFDETTCTWDVSIAPTGEHSPRPEQPPTSLRANVVIGCVGQLNRPSIPAIPGLATFDGPSFHSSRWDHDVTVAGKRVAVIGTGASSMQIVPAIAGVAREVQVFQRSPQWAVPNANYLRDVTDTTRFLMQQVPYYATVYRLRLMWMFSDKLHPTLQRDPDWPYPARSINAQNEKHRLFLTKHVDAQLKDADPSLRAKVLPNYPPYGKRPLMDNNWFAALQRDDVELITSPVTAITADSVLTADSGSYPTDVIVLATGFQTHRLLWPIDIRGRSGVPLAEQWGNDDAWAHLGITIPDFPNFFLVFGPNTAMGHGGSSIYNFEAQASYIAAMIIEMIEQSISAVEVRRDVTEAYKARVDAAHEKMIWTHPGMTNWYRNKAGRVVNNTPWRSVEYWRMIRTPDLNDFLITEQATSRRSDLRPRTQLSGVTAMPLSPE